MPDVEPGMPPARTAELRALDAASSVGGGRILATTLARAQAAAALAGQRREAAVCCWFLDDYQRQLAQPAWPEATNLSLVCQGDLPAGASDLAVIPLARRGEAELARDVLQSACQRLEAGGTLVAAVDNPRDRWLAAQMDALFSKVTVSRHSDATVYVARKREAPRRLRDFRCRFAFRQVETRPSKSYHIVTAMRPWRTSQRRRAAPPPRRLAGSPSIEPS